MLHIELRDTPFHGTTIEVQPDDESLIPGLRDMVECNFQIENPASTFTRIYRSGGFEDVPKEIMNRDAEKLDILSKAWIFDNDSTAGEPAANIIQVLTRLMELYIAARLELDAGSIYIDDGFDTEFDFDEEESGGGTGK